MKRFAILFVLASVLAVTLFGFTPVHGGDNSHGTKCLVSLFSSAKAPCPNVDAIGFAVFHLSVFQTYSLAVLISVLGIVFVLFAFWTVVASPSGGLNASLAFSAYRAIPRQFRTAREWRWYSLHENSPSDL